MRILAPLRSEAYTARSQFVRRSVRRISVDPRVLNGEQASLEGTGIPVSLVLGLLAQGHCEDEVLERLRSSRYADAGRRSVTRDDVRAAIAYGAALAQDEALSLPADDRFLEWKHELGEFSVDEVKARASNILASLAAGESERAVLARSPPLSPVDLRAVMAYGAALAADESLPPAEPETSEQRFLRDDLLPQDRALVDELMAYRAPFHNATPERIFARWQGLVEKVEAGYEDIYDEYVLALSRRDVLEDAVSIVSPLSEERLLRVIRPWDRRFDSATSPATRAIFPAQAKPGRWWWYRVPKRLAGPLEQHLHSAGLLTGPAHPGTVATYS